jgi:hypothetical protein
VRNPVLATHKKALIKESATGATACKSGIHRNAKYKDLAYDSQQRVLLGASRAQLVQSVHAPATFTFCLG